MARKYDGDGGAGEMEFYLGCGAISAIFIAVVTFFGLMLERDDAQERPLEHNSCECSSISDERER